MAKAPKTIPAAKAAPTTFFQTTPLKLVILSLCTGGVYEIWWFYKMWRQSTPNGSKSGAIVRALFSRIFLYELLKKLQVPYAVYLAIAYFALGFAIQLPSVWGVIISYLTFVPVLYVQVHLNKRLQTPVKVPFTKRAIAVAIVGILLSAAFFILASNFDKSSDHNSAKAQAATHYKAATEKTDQQSEDSAENQNSPQTNNDDTSVTTSELPATPIAQNTSASTKSASTKSATTPTAYPTADPEKIKQYAAGFNSNPYPNNPQITSIDISVINNVCGQSNTGFYYDIHFLANAKAGTFAAHWELVSGPNFGTPNTIPSFAWSAGLVEVYDNMPNSLSMGVAPYTLRLHVTSPNDIYSNAITIDSC